MRILRIVYDFADIYVNSEGLSTGPYELSLSQAKNKKDVLFVLTGNLNGRNLKKGRFKYNIGSNLTVYNLPRAVWKFGPFLSSSAMVLPFYFYFRIFKGIDIVHTHQQMGVWFLLYKKLFGWLDKIPVVHTNHGVLKARYRKAKEENQKFDLITKYFEFPLWTLAESLSVEVADSLIAVSTNTKEDIEKEYKTNRNIEVLENGTNTDKFNANGKKADLGFDKDDIKLIYWGRLSKRKNFDLIIKSLKYLPDSYKLAYWGSWYDDLERFALDYIKDNKLENRARYLGVVPYWEVDNYVRAGDIFILPSAHEGLPKVVIEALASGCKVLASGFTVNHKIPNLYFLDEINAKEMAKKTESILKLPNHYNETRKIIEEHYSWDKKVAELRRIYKEALISTGSKLKEKA